jgi:hypothetical protein
VQLEACKAAEAIARHDAGREALAEAGAVRLLLRLARDELHPAQEHAAAALAHAVRLDASGKPPSSTKVVAGPLKNKGKASAGAAAKAASAKVKGSVIHATALDDYRASIPFSDAQDYDVILAHQMNGETLTPKNKGPLFIVYPYDSKPELQTVRFYERSIWQLKSLQVE